MHSNTKLLNPFGEAVTSPLFFVLLKDPFEILITALRHCRYAPMAEGSDCTSILNLYVIPVEVKGRYNTWIDPVTEWGCSKEYVKSHYKECTLEVDDEEDDVLIYSDSGSSELVGYSFKDGGLAFVVVYIKTFYSSEVVNFLTERFFMVPYPEEPLIAAGFNHYDTDKADTYVGLAMENISYLTIGYMVYDKSAESKSSASLECELKNKIDELNQIINK